MLEVNKGVCPLCGGRAEIDWRSDPTRESGFVTAEPRGVHMIPCPTCLGTGRVVVEVFERDDE